MQDEYKSKQQVVSELVLLREQLAELRASEVECRKMRLTLEESEARYRQLSELSPDAIFVHTEGRIVYINAAGAKMLGATHPQEIISRAVMDFVHPDYEKAVRERIHGALEEGRSHDHFLEEKLVRLDGRVVDVEVTSTLLLYQDQPGLLVVARDITERKKAEAERDASLEALKNAEWEKKIILDSQLEHVIYQDREHRILWLNQAACASVRMTREDLIGRHCYEIWPKRSQRCEDCPVDRAMETGQQQEARKTTEDGRVWFIRGCPVLDTNGRVVGAIEVTQEITERVQAEEALRWERDRATALEAAAVVSSTLDPDQVLDRILEQLTRVFPYDAANVMLVEGRQARIVGWRGYERFGAEEQLSSIVFHVPESTILQHMTETKEPVVIPDTNTYPGWVHMPPSRWVRSYASAPIVIRDEVIGFLNVDSATPGFFTQAHAETLRAFADHAAVAIHNARLYKAEQVQRQVEETLRQASTVLSSTLELDEVLDLILEQLQQVIPYDSASVQQVHGEHLKIAACRGFEDASHVVGLVFPLDPKFPNHQVVTAKAPLAIEDIAEDYPHFEEEADTYASGHIRSWLGVPLMVKDQVIGMLALDRVDVRPYTAGEAQLALALANQAAIAIENARLFEETERYRAFNESVVQSMAEGIAVEDSQGYFTFVNPAAATLLGLTPEQLTGQHWTFIIPPDQQPIVHAADERRVRGEADHYEVELVGKDGRRIPVLVSGSPRIEHGEFAGTLAVFTDISERVEAEREIRRRNRSLTLLNQIIAASDSEPETMLETACRELARAFEIPQAAAALLNEEKTEATVVAEYVSDGRIPARGMTIPVKGDPSFQFLLSNKTPLVVRDAQSDPRLEPIHELIRQRGTASLLILPLTVEGEVIGSLGLDAVAQRQFSAEEVSLAWSAADQVAGALARARLNEQRRRLEDQYRQAQKMEAVGRLTAGIAHDFNNLLTAINGFAELTRLQLLPDDPLREMVEKILHSGRRAADLVRQLLTFSRKQIIEPQVLNLNTVVADMEKMLQRVIGEDIELKTSLASDLWPVKVDPTQVGQVLANLAVNARDAMPEGGELIIETANVVLSTERAVGLMGIQPGEYVVLSVGDAGIGMSDAVKAHLFEPFFTTKEPSKGTGLGLATVYGVVRQSGGDIRVYSQEGEGSTFEIYLPRVRESVPAPVRPRGIADVPSGSETLLVVEDDESVRDLTWRVLQGQGYTVLQASHGHEAIQMAAGYAEPIQLLVTDLIMPGMSGKVLADQLTQARPDLKVLFISGYTDELIADHGVLAPGLVLLQKPFRPGELAHKVRQVLDAPGPRMAEAQVGT